MKTVTKCFQGYKNNGFIFEDFIYEKPSQIMYYNGELQAAVNQKVIVKTDTGKIKEENNIIQISKDNGKIWKFVGTTSENLKTVKKLFPNLSPELKIVNKKITAVE